MTPDHKRIFNLLVILALVYGLHTSFGAFMDSFFGKVILVGAIIVSSMDSPVAGGIVALLVIALARRREGFATKDEDAKHDVHTSDDKQSYDDARSFRRAHCHDKEGRKLLVDKQGKAINEDAIKKHFPDLVFDQAECNPCDDSCAFHVTASNERIGTEEQLRGRDSKQHVPDRKNV